MRLDNAMLIHEQAEAAQIRAWVWVLIIFATAFAFVVVGVIAWFDGYDKGAQAERERISLTPKVVEAKPANYLRFQCSKSEFAEYREACLTRRRMEKVTEK